MDDAEWIEAVRREYEKAPALSPLSRKPLPLEVAQSCGLRSAAMAAKRAFDGQEQHSDLPAGYVQPALFDLLEAP